MKTILLSLMLLLSTSIFADSNFSNNKMWIDLGGIAIPQGPFFIGGGSLNLTKDSIHYRLKAGAERFGDDNYTQFYHADILAGKQFSINKYMKFSALAGLGFISIEKSPYDLEEKDQRFFKTISVPIELEFMVHLKHVGLAVGVYSEINTVSQLVGANIKISFGNM